MPIKTDLHLIKGMLKDMSVSKASSEFAFDALNIRLTAREGNTMLSVTNEKGNKKVTLLTENGSITQIEGTVIGHSIINQYLILFTTSVVSDKIYRLEKKSSYFEVVPLYEGDLNFDTQHPIESIGIFENENILKVYWVDGKNPVRFLNITEKYTGGSDIFNFSRNLSLIEDITISCNNEVKGNFPSGVVQYVFSYYNRHGSESNIFYQSPLYYSHLHNRGGSPEELASNSFSIKLSNLDSSFDYIRVYSILRTSIDATPTVKHVVDLVSKEGEVTYTDTNANGELVDPTLLLYIGGENIIPECITHKDNTLFLGNYKLNNNIFEDSDKITALSGTFSFDYKETPKYEARGLMYGYTTLLNYNSYQITTLKSNETYRFGILFQDKTGKWSEVLHVGDKKVSLYPKVNVPSTISELFLGNTLVKGKYSIPSSLISKAVSLGYVRARGVIVHPSAHDREVICLGVLNPTVYKADDRKSHTPDVYSSWFFRPYVKNASFFYESSLYGSIATYTDSRNVNYLNGKDVNSDYSGSIIPKSIEIGADLSYTDSEGDVIDRDFYVDANIVTMHSPDIEFLDTINSYTDSYLKCRIIGYVNINNNSSFRDVQASTPSADVNDFGFYDKFPTVLSSPAINLGMYTGEGSILISGTHWSGKAILPSDDGWIASLYYLGWLVSPWQRSGSLINDFAKRENSQVVSKLKHNRLINTRVSYETVYKGVLVTPTISRIGVFDSNESTLLQIGDTGLLYYGNVDKVLIPGSKAQGKGSKVGYTQSFVSLFGDNSIEALYNSTAFDFATSNYVDDEDYKYSRDPVSMKYKSSKHAVFQFTGGGTNRVLLPSISGSTFNHSDSSKVSYTTLSTDSKHYAVLWLAELYRDVESSIKFGGNTEEALLNNRWVAAGDPVDITNSYGTALSSASVEYLQGDTYLQRYDCLKTYPFSLEDENNVTDVLSFFCETRVNIDGRYDRNRGSLNNLALSPNIFNLLNPVYTQSNNYFNYRTLDPSLKVNNFNNSITWSKEKSLGEEIDQWTNLTLSSTLEMDGDKGEITALKTFNNEIYCFQKLGISNILFNSRVQIPTSDGVPIEITNGLKVQGKRYLSSIGCSNKWSIAESPVGLYFIDSNTDEIYLFNGQITSLSTQLGFSSYVKEHNHLNKWNPSTFDNFRTHYDKSNGDVYFTDKTSCLVYSESLGQFTSFMSYEETPYMFNIDNSFYAIKNNKIWELFAGEYNSFYGEVKPYSITVISNPDSFYDKIFNNIEFRADTWDGSTLMNNVTFDTLEVWNEYLRGTASLINTKDKPSSLKRKFRIWRANIPRDNFNNRDRIRNTWAYVKLSHNNPSNYRTEFHDLVVHYFL